MYNKTTLYIDDLCVSEKSRGHKVGTKLYEFVLSPGWLRPCSYHGGTGGERPYSPLWRCFSQYAPFGQLVRQGLATLSTAAGQYLSAVLGGHSLSEAVLHLCVPLLRLESSFHLADLCSLHRRLERGFPKRRAVYFSGDTLRNTSVIAADRKKGGRALANYKWHSRAAAAVLACLMTAAALPLSTAFAAKAPSTDTAQTTAVSAEETGTDTGGDLSYEEQETYSDYYDTYRDEPRPEAEILLSGADFQKADCTGYETGSYSDRNGESRENVLVWNSAEGSFSYTLNVPETGLYCVQASYCPIVSNTAEISVSLAIDGEVPYDTASRLKLNKVYQNQSEIKTDDSGNQVRPIQEQTELWQTCWIGDSDGLFNDPVFFYLEKGTHEITLSSQKAYFALESLRFAQPDEVPAYAEYTDSVNAAVSKEDTKIQF